MANYTIGLLPENRYLVKRNGSEMMNIGPGNWIKIFPDTMNGPIVFEGEKISEKNFQHFKISSIFPTHRLANKYYLKYLAGQIGNVDEDILAKDIEKICKWAGEDDIIYVPRYLYSSQCILTASVIEGERVGFINHKICGLKIKWSRLMSKYRVWKLKHFKQKKSAKRQNFILSGETITTTSPPDHFHVVGDVTESGPETGE